MPIIEYQCMSCEHVQERIIIAPPDKISNHTYCEKCEMSAFRIMSTPARIEMADMEKVTKRRQRIKEPVWRDQETGKVTSVF